MASWFRSKPKNKFSLDYLKYLYSQLQKYPVITRQNQQTVVECLRGIAELMIWGDQHNPSFFDFFAEKGILAQFVKLLGQNCDSKVKVQIIQTLSILIQNTSSEISVFYLLSNNHINDLIVHPFDFNDEELLAYYISFLKTLSLKLNSKTILFFFNEQANDFPLYSEAIKFFNHPESMVRAAVRTLSLNVYKVDYEPLRRFILDRSAVPYFSNLSWFLRDETLQLDTVLEKSTYLNYSRLEEKVEAHIDLFYYLQDILNLGIEALSHKLVDQLLSQFVLPLLVGSIVPSKAAQHDTASTTASAAAAAAYPPPMAGSLVAPAEAPLERRESRQQEARIATRLALFLLTQLFLVFNDAPFLNSVATALLDPRPPRLALALVSSPPAHPVAAHCPLTSIIHPKSVKPASPSPSSAGSGSSTSSSERKSRNENKDLPPDENLKARSKLPDVGPTVTLEQVCPDYSKTSHINPYREALLACLSDPDERVVFACLGFLLSIIRNECVDRELLLRAELLPQVQRKARSILAELTAGVESPLPASPSPSSPLPDANGDSAAEACANATAAIVSPLVSVDFELLAGAQQGDGSSDGKQAPLVRVCISPLLPPAAATRDGAGERETPHEREATAHRTSGDSAAAEPAEPQLTEEGRAEQERGRGESSASAGESARCDSEYSAELVEPLLAILHRQPSCTLVTLQLAAELLSDLCYHRGRLPCLLPHHLRILDVAYRAVTTGLKAAFNGPLAPFLLDLFEEEWGNAQKRVNWKSIVSNALAMLPIADNPISGAPLDFRRPSGETERTRKAVQVFFLLSLLRNKMLNLPESFPLALEGARYRAGDEVEMVGFEMIPCRIVVPLEPGQSVASPPGPGPKAPAAFLVLEKSMLLLVERHPSKANWAVVVLAIPSRHQEAVVSRSNACVLNIALKSQVRPHLACKRIPPAEVSTAGSSTVGGLSLSIKAATEQAASGIFSSSPAVPASPPPQYTPQPFSSHNRWQLTLLFPEPGQCADAKRHLDTSGAELRTELVNKILAYMG